MEKYYSLMYSSLPLSKKLSGLYQIIQDKPDFYHAYVSASSIMSYGGTGFHSPFPSPSFQHNFLLFLYRKNLSLPVNRVIGKIKSPPANPFIIKELMASGWKGKVPFPREVSEFLAGLNRSFPPLLQTEKVYRKYSSSPEPETSLFFVFWYLNSLLINRRASLCYPLIVRWERKTPFHYPFWFLRHYYYAISKNPRLRLFYILKAAQETRNLYLIDLFHLYNRMVATSYGKLGDLNKALYRFSESLKFYEKYGKRMSEVDVLISRAYLFYENYIYQSAMEDLKKALNLLGDAPTYKRAYIHSLLALIYLKMGKYTRAEGNARLGLKEAKKFKFTAAYFASKLALGRLALIKGEFQKALEVGKELEGVGKKRGDRELAFSAISLEKEAFVKLGNYQEAVNKLKEALSLAPTLRDRFKVNLELYRIYKKLASLGIVAGIVYSLKSYPYIVRAKGLAEEIEEEKIPTKEMKYEFLKNKMEVFAEFGRASLRVARIIIGFFLIFGVLILLGARTVKGKGNLLGSYRIIRELGRGGMGRVYLSREVQTGERVALKIMDGIRAPAEDIKGFLEEAELLRKLRHPNIVRFLDSGQIGSTFYIAMEYVKGKSLFDLGQNAPPPFSSEEIREISLGTASALSYLHSKMIVHRDIKPSNILLEGHFSTVRGVNRREVKLTDFGIARRLAAYVEATGTITGTPHYISPETLSQGMITPASDVYSFGVVLYWMVTGHLPHGQSDFPVLISRILSAIPPSPSNFVDLSPCLEEIIMKSLSKNPENRYSSGTELYKALIHCYGG